MNEHDPDRCESLRKMMMRMGEEPPSTMGAFGRLHSAAAGEGALNPKMKEFMAESAARESLVSRGPRMDVNEPHEVEIG